MASGPPGVGGKRKASTHSPERTSSIRAGSDGSDLDLGIQLAVSKKARKTAKEPIEVEETDELDELFIKRKQGRKPGKKGPLHARDSDDDDEDSYKNTFILCVPGAAGSARRVELKSVAPYHQAYLTI